MKLKKKINYSNKYRYLKKNSKIFFYVFCSSTSEEKTMNINKNNYVL